MALQRAQALCEPEYTDYLVRITEARHKALTAKIQYEARLHSFCVIAASSVAATSLR